MRRVLAAIAGAAFLHTPSLAAESPPIWAAPGLYGLENTGCVRAIGEITAMISAPLCPALDVARAAAGPAFATSMARHFPNVSGKFAASLPADATPRARLSSGLVASLRLTRASIWTVPKGNGVDAFLPVTLTLDITNPATGEVVFTRTRSEIGEGVFSKGAAVSALTAQLPRQIAAMIEKLVISAAADWRPTQQVATVIGRAGDAWVVDRGKLDGYRTDEFIGADGHILFAGPRYAIVRPTLGRYQQGQKLERTSVTPAALLARPSVLTRVIDVPDGYSATYLTQTFEDALGSGTSFSPLPINPAFELLRTMALGEAEAPSTDPRPLPDYVASVSVAPLAATRFASNVPGVTIERHSALAFVSLIDRTGRIVHSAQGHGFIEDRVSADMRFSTEQRRDTVVRNALLDAAAKLSSFKPRAAELPVQQTDRGILIDDRAGALPLGTELVVLRSAGRVGSNERVFYPVGALHTREVSAAGILADSSGPEALEVRKGDMVATQQAGPALSWRRLVGRCTRGSETLLDDRGNIPAPVAGFAADGYFSARFPGPVQRSGLAAALQPLDAHFAAGSWKRFGPASAATVDRCFVPVVAVAPAPKGYALTAGFTLFEGGRKLGGSGLQAVLLPTQVPPGTPADQAQALLDQDIARELLPLLERAASTLPTLPTLP